MDRSPKLWIALVLAAILAVSSTYVSAATFASPAGSQAAQTDKNFVSKEVISQCSNKADSLRGRLDGSFNVHISAPFVVAGNISADMLKKYSHWCVSVPAQAMWTNYFDRKPTDTITVLLFADGGSYRYWAKKLYGDTKVAYFGYYRPDKKVLLMNISTGTGTLVHELTHSLIGYDFPHVPLWFNEGLASLHEQSSVDETQIIGQVNWRLPALQKAIHLKKLRPLRDLITKQDFYGPLLGINYAQARFFCMYMQKRGLLQKFYKHFRDNHNGPGSEERAIEHVFGRSVDEVEAEFLDWVMTLRFKTN